MKIDGRLTDEAVLAELGERISRWRLERNMSQADFGQEAGIGRRTVQRLEAGEPVQLQSFVRALRVLGLLDALDRLVPPAMPSPIERLRRAGRERRRAREGSQPASEQPTGPWRWGDEERSK